MKHPPAPTRNSGSSKRAATASGAAEGAIPPAAGRRRLAVGLAPGASAQVDCSHANGDGRRDGLITPHDQSPQLGPGEDWRREAYRALFKAHTDEETVDRIRAATNGNDVLGGSRFEAEIAATLKRRVARGKAGRTSKAGAELGQLRLMDG